MDFYLDISFRFPSEHCQIEKAVESNRQLLLINYYYELNLNEWQPQEI